MSSRIQKYAEWDTSVGENIHYGSTPEGGQEAVLGLLIDGKCLIRTILFQMEYLLEATERIYLTQPLSILEQELGHTQDTSKSLSLTMQVALLHSQMEIQQLLRKEHFVSINLLLIKRRKRQKDVQMDMYNQMTVLQRLLIKLKQ